MNALPFLEELVMQLGGQQPVHNHRVGHVAEQIQICVGALGLFDDHLLQVQHDAHRRDLRIGQDLAHAVEIEQQVFERGVDLVRGQWHGHHRLEHRAGHAHRAARPGIDLVQPPFGGVGKSQQLQGFACRRTVDDQDVVLSSLRVVLDPHQRCDLVHPGRVGDLVGDDLVQPLGGKDLDRVFVQLRPMALHLMERRDFMGP